MYWCSAGFAVLTGCCAMPSPVCRACSQTLSSDAQPNSARLSGASGDMEGRSRGHAPQQTPAGDFSCCFQAIPCCFLGPHAFRGTLLVLVSLGCSSKGLQTGGGVNSRYSVLTVLEAGSRSPECQCGQVFVRTLFLTCRRLSSGYVLTQGELWCCVLDLEGHASHHEGATLMPSSKPNYLPKAPPPNVITLGVRASPQGF